LATRSALTECQGSSCSLRCSS